MFEYGEIERGEQGMVLGQKQTERRAGSAERHDHQQENDKEAVEQLLAASRSPLTARR